MLRVIPPNTAHLLDGDMHLRLHLIGQIHIKAYNYVKLILCSPNGNEIYFLNQWNSWLVNLKPPLFMHAATLLGWHTCLTIIKVMSITLASFPTVSGTLCRKADLRTEGGANVGTLAEMAELRTFLSYTKYK